MAGKNAWVWVMVALAAGGCATGAHDPFDAERGELVREHVVEVTNRSYEGMQIYAAQGATTYPLGTVGVNQTRSFRLPAAFAGRIGGIQLMARTRSRTTTHRSEVIMLAPGQSVGWSLESNLKLSFHWIRSDR